MLTTNNRVAAPLVIAALVATAHAFAQEQGAPVQAAPAAQPPPAQQIVNATQAPPQIVQQQVAVESTAKITTTSATFPGRESRVEEGYTPNRSLLVSGALMLGFSYAASVVVAAESSHRGDDHLYVPIVGPWLDFVDRGDCPATSPGCDTETTARVFIVAAGVLQGLGALQLAGAFLFPEHVVTASTSARREEHPALKMRLSPAKLGRTGYGLSASAAF
jgi:hypothetical protein